MDVNDARRNAYRYILERLSRLPADPQKTDSYVWIPLDDLRLLKEGVAGPSAELVSSLSILLEDVVAPGEIHAHLVAPFTSCRSIDTGKV